MTYYPELDGKSKNSSKAVSTSGKHTVPGPRPSESICQLCGGVNPVWFAPNELWNKMAGDYHFLCPNCFIQKAEKLGIKECWSLTTEKSASALMIRERLDELALFDQAAPGVKLNQHALDVTEVNEYLAKRRAQLSASSKGERK